MASDDSNPIVGLVLIFLVVLLFLFVIYKILCAVFALMSKMLGLMTRQKLLGFLFGLTAILVALNFGPPYFEFDSYSVEPPLPFEGALSLNSALNNGERLFEDEIKGPESLAVYNNVLYTGLMTGEIVAVADGKLTVVADLLQPCRGSWDLENCGRPLGLSFDKQGNLWVTDAYYGIYKVDINSGSYELVVPTNKPIATNETLNEFPLLPNAVVAASDGILYWSDSSTQVPLHDLLISMLGDKSGRLIKTNPETGESQVLMSGLRFANGVFLAPDESYIAIAETLLYRVHRHWLKGPKKGQSEVFVDRLPGAPDNLSPTEDGGFIINLVQGRSALLEILAPFSGLRRFLAQLVCQIQLLFQKIDDYYPSDFNKEMIAYIGHYSSIARFMASHSIAVFCDKDGNILKSLHSTDGMVPTVSDVVALDGYFYLGSPHNHFLGRVKAESEGWF